MAKKKAPKRLYFSRDRSGRSAWRDAKGRFHPAPKLTELRKDKHGIPRDSRGRFVPARAVVLPPPPPEPIAVRSVAITEPVWSTIEGPFVTKRFPNFSHLNRQFSTGALQIILSRTFEAHARKGDIDPDDMRVYEYGVLFRPGGKIDNHLLSRITKALEGTEARVLHIREDRETDSVQIRFGSSEVPGYFPEVSDGFYEFGDALQDVWDVLATEFYGDVDWALFWETDEQAYDEEAA